MTANLTRLIRRRAAGAVAAAAVAVATGCSTAGGTADAVPAVPVSISSPVTSSAAAGTPVLLRFGSHAVNATLADTTAASRQLAGMLPLSLDLTDAWGQAKSGRLAHAVTVEGAARIVRPTPGGIYYWPDNGVIAVYYDDLGQSVPPPGLIPLGEVDTGLADIAEAGRHVTVRIER